MYSVRTDRASALMQEYLGTEVSDDRPWNTQDDLVQRQLPDTDWDEQPSSSGQASYRELVMHPISLRRGLGKLLLQNPMAQVYCGLAVRNSSTPWTAPGESVEGRFAEDGNLRQSGQVTLCRLSVSRDGGIGRSFGYYYVGCGCRRTSAQRQRRYSRHRINRLV